MSGERFFLETVTMQARVDRGDQYHTIAKAFGPRVRAATEVWTTEAVLIEIGNALSATNRQDASRFIAQCYRTVNFRVVSVDRPLLFKALDLYRDRPDKGWGLTDCISFTVMEENGLVAALTADKHFVQAGFRALLLERA